MTFFASTFLFWFHLPVIILSATFCLLVILRGTKDAPDSERKKQAVAVPTSGGIGIALAAFIFTPLATDFLGPVLFFDYSSAITYGAQFNELAAWPHIAFAVSALLLGAADDRWTLNTKLKFSLMGVAAIATVFFGGRPEFVFLPVVDSTVYLAPWITLIGCALWIFVMMNATNFMDGSNGIAMGTLVIMLIAICIKLIHTENVFILAHIPAILAAAILGFLLWNLQGKLYAGDAGSLFGGAVFASLGLYAAQDGNIWFPATLALPFLVDVFMTLLWRARRGHNLLTPHRHHAYQLFIRSGWTHIKTALLWWALATICAIAALWAASESKSMSAWVFFGLLGAGCALWIAQRRHFRTLAENG